MTSPAWHVVICARRLEVAKSRLRALGEVERRALALAMTSDVLEAIARVPAVTELVVVTDDPTLGRIAITSGAVVLTDPGLGLNQAFIHGIHGGSPHTWKAMLMADLPCLTSEILQRVLDEAARYESAVVPDRASTGSTLLTIAPGGEVRPRFGIASFSGHLGDGAVAVGVGEPGARCDVDTAADLAAAARIGLGRHTSRSVRRMSLDSASLNTQL